VTLGEEELDTVGDEDTLLERETLLLLVARGEGGRKAGSGGEWEDEGKLAKRNGRSGGRWRWRRAENMRKQRGISAVGGRGREEKGWTNVVTTGNPHDVTLELVSEGIGGDLLGHTLLVEDATAVRCEMLVSPCF
jgi:hypothetical protein